MLEALELASFDLQITFGKLPEATREEHMQQALKELQKLIAERKWGEAEKLIKELLEKVREPA